MTGITSKSVSPFSHDMPEFPVKYYGRMHDPPTSHDFLQIFGKKVMAVENPQNKKI